MTTTRVILTVALMLGALVLAAACSEDDPDPALDGAAAGQEAAVPDDAVAGPDLAALGSCSNWSSWKATGSVGFVCEHKCGKYTLQCTSGMKGGSCSCNDMQTTGHVGAGTYSFCYQPSTGDPDDCRKSHLEGCCLQLVK